jgi:hypothetical protein
MAMYSRCGSVGGSCTAVRCRVIGRPAAALVVASRPVQINVRPRGNRARRHGAGVAHGEKNGGSLHESAPGRQRGVHERGGDMVEEEAWAVGYSGWVVGGGRAALMEARRRGSRSCSVMQSRQQRAAGGGAGAKEGDDMTGRLGSCGRRN